jgi:hypothetical protein
MPEREPHPHDKLAALIHEVVRMWQRKADLPMFKSVWPSSPHKAPGKRLRDHSVDELTDILTWAIEGYVGQPMPKEAGINRLCRERDEEYIHAIYCVLARWKEKPNVDGAKLWKDVHTRYVGLEINEWGCWKLEETLDWCIRGCYEADRQT